MSAFSIEGFPTIYVFKNGINMGKYNGDRSEEALMSYAKREFQRSVLQESTPTNDPTPDESFDMILLFLVLVIILCIGGGYLLFSNKK